MSRPPAPAARDAAVGSHPNAEAYVRIDVAGQVQGVGFRPYVYREACALGLRGTVRNVSSGVRIEAAGPARRVAELIDVLREGGPPMARIDHLHAAHGPVPGLLPDTFVITDSDTRHVGTGRVTVDVAVCDACLEELLDPSNRRFRHGLINCTDCGPRYSIVRDLPYDRAQTTMAGFALCPRCRTEYADPKDRRFHAQPVNCPDCGPQPVLVAEGLRVEGDPFLEAARVLDRGDILLVKGIGGFHLVTDACSREAVARLRERKRREHKPLAVMVRDLEMARSIVCLSVDAESLLVSPASPIVIGRSIETGMEPPAPNVAGGLDRLGVMLPNTPIQHLLARAFPRPMVMTSANLADEPLLKDDGEAAALLCDVADAMLTHDRPIERAVDDSVFIDGATGPIPVRRARGFVPAPIALLPRAPVPGLCMGADLKNVIALARDGEAILGQHVGDLSHPLAMERCLSTARDLCRLFDLAPQWVAVDAHPRYLSRRVGARLAGEHGIPLVEVQHHHAHLASLLAEHGRTERIVGVVCDGVGYGSDGSAWGGELLVGNAFAFERAAHLRPLRMPGGDAAARTTGRCAAAWMTDALGMSAAADHPALAGALPDPRVRATVLGLLDADLNCPPSTGMGRLFDAAASLLGLCEWNHYEAMSGLLLEAAAGRSYRRPSGAGLVPLECGVLDTRPLLYTLLEGLAGNVPTCDLAWLFHDAMADGLARASGRVAAGFGLDTVGLTGGVFCNALLTRLTQRAACAAGLRVITHHRVPPNDGGIALGQAAVAAARIAFSENR